MKRSTRHIGRAVLGFSLICACPIASEAQRPSERRRETAIRAGSRQTIVSVNHRESSAATRSTAVAGVLPFPKPPLVGFSPLIAIATSDKREPSSADLAFEHKVESSYIGAPLNFPASQNFVIGFLDSGADVDLAAGTFADILGLNGFALTGNAIPIGGVGGTVDALISQPVAIFAAGLSAIGDAGSLDTTQLVGHSNTSIVVAPTIDCGNGEIVTAVVGMPFMAFYNSVIRVDQPQRVTVGGVTYQGPSVTIQSPDIPLPQPAHEITLEFGGLAPVTTASFFPDLEDLQTPITPTLMSLSSLSFPTGGAFFATLSVLEGDPSPINPIQAIRVLVDTGAQSSVISPGVAANLNLPFDPDFTVDVCGVGGFVSSVPGFNIDLVRINARGGALSFSDAPFVVLDLPSVEGGALDGILGMNFFWNRNVTFKPSLTGTGFLHVSEPIPFAYGDFDLDFDVDTSDLQTMLSCYTGPGASVAVECDHLDVDLSTHVDLLDFAQFQRCFSSPDTDAEPNCGR